MLVRYLRKLNFVQRLISLQNVRPLTLHSTHHTRAESRLTNCLIFIANCNSYYSLVCNPIGSGVLTNTRRNQRCLNVHVAHYFNETFETGSKSITEKYVIFTFIIPVASLTKTVLFVRFAMFGFEFRMYIQVEQLHKWFR